MTALVAASISICLFYNIHSKKNFLSKPDIKSEFIPSFSLPDLKNNVYDSKKIIGLSPFTLFVFFSPSDCRSCLLERELWKEIFKSRKVNIIGIAKHADKKELKDWIENSAIPFIVLYDEKGILSKRLGINRTPLKLLVDNKGKILFVDYVRVTSAEQKSFVNELDKRLGFFSN